ACIWGNAYFVFKYRWRPILWTGDPAVRPADVPHLQFSSRRYGRHSIERWNGGYCRRRGSRKPKGRDCGISQIKKRMNMKTEIRCLIYLAIFLYPSLLIAQKKKVNVDSKQHWNAPF